AAALPYIQDLVTDESPAMRAAAIRACAAIDPAGFSTLLSGMEPDPHWIVRSAIAEALGSMPTGFAVARLRAMLDDPDQRGVPAVLDSLTTLKAPGLEEARLAQR